MTDYRLSTAGKMLDADPKTLKIWLNESHIVPREVPGDRRARVISDKELKTIAEKYHRTVKDLGESKSTDGVQTTYVESEQHQLGEPTTTQGDISRIIKEVLQEMESAMTQRMLPLFLEEAAKSLGLPQGAETASDSTKTDTLEEYELPANNEMLAGVKMRVYEKLISEVTAAELAAAHGATSKAWDWPVGTRKSVPKVIEHIWNSLHDPLSKHKRHYPKSSWKECKDLACPCHSEAEKHLRWVTPMELKEYKDRRPLEADSI